MSYGIYYFKKNFCSYNLHKLLQDIWTLGHFHYGFFWLREVVRLLSYFNMMILLLFTLILTYLQLMKQD